MLILYTIKVLLVVVLSLLRSGEAWVNTWLPGIGAMHDIQVLNSEYMQF